MIPAEKDVISLSKKGIQELAKTNAQNEIESGDINPLTKYLLAKAIADYMSSYVSEMHDAASLEFEKYPEKEIELLGRKVSQFESGVRYDFSNTNHQRLKELEQEEIVLKEKIKAIQDTLKAIKEPMTLVDEDSGETYQVRPAIKTSKTSLKVVY